MSTNSPAKRKNRKRKKTFLGNARKYAKKGHFGRGSKIEEDTFQFFLRSLEAFKLGFDDDESRDIFVENVFEHTENQELDCACNQVGCRVIETLLPYASDCVLERFMQKFSDELRPLINDRFASFVLQGLVSVSSKKSLDTNISSEKQAFYRQFVIKISKFLLNNLEDYVWDNIGNRVIRVCLGNLLQIPLEDKEKPTKFIAKTKTDDVPENLPEEYIEIVKEFGQRLILWPQFNEMCCSELTSGLFQALLKALKAADSKLLKKYLEKLLHDCFLKSSNLESKTLPQGFMSLSLSMLLETALQVAGKKMFSLYVEKLFIGRMLQLACLKSTTFAVQKVLIYCSNKELFDEMFDELADHFGDIIEKGHPAVLLALSEACKRLSSKQGLFIQNMIKCLNCHEPEDRQQHFILCMSRLTPYSSETVKLNDNLSKEKLNLQGTLMLQTMLEFNKPIKIVNSLMSMDTNTLKNLLSNSMGSHIVDSFVKSIFVGEKSREKLVRKMTGTYQELAASKYGSRSFEALWNAANLKAKLHIMEELAHKDGSWSNTDCGRIIASKINLVMYKRNKENWKTSIVKTSKPEDVLADVLK